MANVHDDWIIYRNPAQTDIIVPAFDGCLFTATPADNTSGPVTYTLDHLERRERLSNEGDLYLDEVQTRIKPLRPGDVIDHPYRGAWIATPAGFIDITPRMRAAFP